MSGIEAAAILSAAAATFLVRKHDADPSGTAELIRKSTPIVLPGLVLGLLARQTSAKASGGHFFESRFTRGAFPYALITALGAVSISEFVHLAIRQPGGLGAWVPLLSLAVSIGFAAHYFQHMASGSYPDYPIPYAVGAIAPLRTAFSGVYTQVGKQFTLRETVSDPAGAARQLGKKAGKKFRDVTSSQPEVELPQIPDWVSDNLPYLVGSGIAVLVVARLFSGQSVFPQRVLSGPFPWSVMAAGVTYVLMTLLHSIQAHKTAAVEDFVPLIAVAVSASLFARWGIKLQAAA